MEKQASGIMYAYAAFSPDRIEKVPLSIPEPDDYEVLVKNEGCVFCNTTDKMIVENLFSTPDYPVVFGHESFGKVVKVGKRVTKYKLGDRVSSMDMTENTIPPGAVSRNMASRAIWRHTLPTVMFWMRQTPTAPVIRQTASSPPTCPTSKPAFYSLLRKPQARYSR